MTRPEYTAAVARSVPPVLVLADHLGYSGGIAHGVTRYFQQVMPALRAAGIDLTVCFLREPHIAAEPLRKGGIDPIFLRAARWDPLVALKVAAIARRRGAGLLHVTGLKGTLVGRIAARLVGAAVILHTHDLNEPGWLMSRLQRSCARPTDFGIGVSEPVRDLTVRGYHVAPDRTVVLHSGIRLEEIRNLSPDARIRTRTQLGLSMSQPVLGMIGRLYPVKGHRAMLEMLPTIIRQCPDVMLLVAGEGPEREACAALTAELGLGKHVRFLGQTDDVAGVLSAVDILVMPSRSEGLPLAAIEALAAGKPVVAFAVGGLCEVIVDRLNGRLVPAGDRAGFANALLDLLRDERQRFSYGERAAMDSARFSLESHVQQLISCYQRVTGTWSNTPSLTRNVLS